MIQNSDAIFQEIDTNEIINTLMSISNRSIPRSARIYPLLNKLSAPIAILVKDGYSFNEISDMLRLCDINVTGVCIHEFILSEQLKRISNIESSYTQRHRNELNTSAYLLSEMESELRKSIRRNEGLFLAYQPQINVVTGKIIGAEALVRWKVKGGIIQPSDFIKIAERSDLIIELGDWIVKEACKEAKRWDDISLGGSKPIKISVNVSVKQLDDQLPDMFSSIIRANRLSPESLGIEITESFMLEENYISVLNKFKQNGIRLSIDDFGTGYSCLSELKTLPFDVIKIDRSFVQNLETENRSSMMIDFIINLADRLGMTTLAEGVETSRQVDALRELGCNTIQGFHFSQPLSGNDFIRFVDHGIFDIHL
jgi:EAL domain-containing protein (putative c-di-GMP-specific phosphodiesterase class I)